MRLSVTKTGKSAVRLKPPFGVPDRGKHKKNRKALEAVGWRFGDAADFLGMSDEERHLLDARVEAALAVRRQREATDLSGAKQKPSGGATTRSRC
jgi:hypothetical protein